MIGLCLSCAGMMAACAAHAQGGAPAGPRNIIVNGGFEDWAPLDPNTAQREDVRNIDLVPPNSGPVGWTPMRELTKGQARTATIAMDETIKHSGARSVRIKNGDMRDITYVYYSTEPFASHPDDPHNIQPNRRYMVRWWVRGENVEPSGTGPIMMMNYMSQKDGKWYRTDTYELGVPLPTGAFDWQQRQFVFITDEYAKWAAFTFQLRWTTGAVWYDDVELLDIGPVVRVETY